MAMLITHLRQRRHEQHMPPIEQLGTYDPLPNEHNEQLVSLNFERIRHWIGNGALVSKPVERLFGLAGFFPIHPTSYMTSWRNRKSQEEAEHSAEDNTKQNETTKPL